MSNIGIGSKLYRFDANRRVYNRNANGYSYGPPIYREHFAEIEVHGETRLSWLAGSTVVPYKVSKREIAKGRAGSFYTKEAMEDDVWQNSHAHLIADIVRRSPADQLRKIAEIIGYEART